MVVGLGDGGRPAGRGLLFTFHDRPNDLVLGKGGLDPPAAAATGLLLGGGRAARPRVVALPSLCAIPMTPGFECQSCDVLF